MQKYFKDKYRSIFLIAIFLLPKYVFVSSFLFSIICLKESLSNKNNFFKDKYNFFILCSIFMILGSIYNYFYFDEKLIGTSWEPKLAFIGTLNWLPFFYIFWIFQTFLNTEKKRHQFSIALLAGTFPLFLSGFSQYFLKIFGPFKTFFGTIIWYQREVNSESGLSSVFNNPNYAGTWFCAILPFAIFHTINNKNTKINRSISFLFCFLIFLSIFLTQSRNALIGLFLGFIPLIKASIISLLIFSILFLFLFFIILNSLIFKQDFNINNYLINFNQINNIRIFEIAEFPRILIWLNSLKLTMQKPIFGWGASTFDKLYQFPDPIASSIGQIYVAHSHNIVFDISISYGIPAAIFFSFNILLILYKLINLLRIEEIKLDQYKQLDIAIPISLIILCVSQLFDITYFDGRISILFWLLVANGVSIIKERRKGKNHIHL